MDKNSFVSCLAIQYENCSKCDCFVQSKCEVDQWSINSYVLSKVWFKCGTVDLRVSDINAINSSVKSWLYADLLEKPSEAIMCRPVSYGGLGVTSVKHKALAILIKTFLETAAIPKFRHSLLHTSLYRFHVLEDSSIPDPGYLPYYPPSFFNTIKYVHNKKHHSTF